MKKVLALAALAMTGVLAALVAAFVLFFMAAVGVEEAEARPTAGPSGQALADIPPELLAVYRQAARETCGMRWSVLAAIGPEGSIARGATAYAASAWSRDIGSASGALLVMGGSGRAGAGEESARVELPRAITSRSPLEGSAGVRGGRVGGPARGRGVGPGVRMPAALRDPGQASPHPPRGDEATTDPVLIREWWRRSPGANVGIATGASSGLVMVDLDLPRGGRESLGAVLDAGRDLPRTLRGAHRRRGASPVLRGAAQCRGGEHRGSLPGVARALPGIDLRGDGGYVVVPPSVHASARRYRWDRRAGVSALPRWL